MGLLSRAGITPRSPHHQKVEDDDRTLPSYGADVYSVGSTESADEYDPDLSCTTCGQQTHSYIRKGITRTSNRNPLTIPGLVRNGECLTCRLAELRKECEVPSLFSDNSRKKKVDDDRSSVGPFVKFSEKGRTGGRATGGDDDTLFEESVIFGQNYGVNNTEPDHSGTRSNNKHGRNLKKFDADVDQGETNEYGTPREYFPADMRRFGSSSRRRPPPIQEVATSPIEDEDDPLNPNTADVSRLVHGLSIVPEEDYRLARKFLVSLRTMSIHHPNRVSIAQAGGIEAVVECMGRFQIESEIGKQACAALQNLACDDENERRCVESGAIAAILGSMGAHSRSPGVQEHGAAALRNLTASSATNRVESANCGGIEILIMAIENHPDRSEMLEKCLGALTNFCIKNDTNRAAIGREGGVRVIVQILDEHGHVDKNIAEKGLRCLLKLSYTEDNVEMIRREVGAEDIVLGVAHAHGGRLKEWALRIFLKM